MKNRSGDRHSGGRDAKDVEVGFAAGMRNDRRSVARAFRKRIGKDSEFLKEVTPMFAPWWQAVHPWVLKSE